MFVCFVFGVFVVVFELCFEKTHEITCVKLFLIVAKTCLRSNKNFFTSCLLFATTLLLTMLKEGTEFRQTQYWLLLFFVLSAFWVSCMNEISPNSFFSDTNDIFSWQHFSPCFKVFTKRHMSWICTHHKLPTTKSHNFLWIVFTVISPKHFICLLHDCLFFVRKSSEIELTQN